MATEGVKRKISAILSADVAGYSKLMEADEETTVRTMESYRKSISSLIEQHNGRVVDSPGDNILSEFASVVDAVQCAVEVQHVIKAKNAMVPESRRMQFRIGISLEDVIEEGDRIYGDGVNIASRIEGMADPGGICISGAAYEQIKRKLALGYEDMGEHPVKNISWPVQVYRIPLDSGVATDTRKDTTASLPEKPSIAVLPFVNMSNDPDNEYFSDGVSEGILNSLVKTNALPVIARTSSFQFKGKNLSVQKIASELNVTHVMEGSVQKAGNEVRVTAQLVDAKTGVHLWSESYDRELTSAFALQDEIAAAIVEEVQMRVGSKESVRTRVVDKAAYDIYLQAQERLHRLDPSRKDAIGLFEKAVEIDPRFTDAWTGLANAYMDRIIGMIPKEVAPLAKAALLRALEIEKDNAAALSLLGYIRAQIEYQWIEGAELMARATRLGPQDAEIQTRYGLYLALTQQSSATEAIEKAYRLDPLSLEVVGNYIADLRVSGRQLDAERVLESHYITADTEVVGPFGFITHFAARNMERAEQAYEKAKAIWGAHYPWVRIYEFSLAKRRGDEDLAESIEQELLRRMESEYVPYVFGSPKSLKKRLQLAYQQRQPDLVRPVLRPYPLPQFTDTEWNELRERMNIGEIAGDIPPWGRPRTEEEKEALIKRRVKVDPSLIQKYAGVYKWDSGPGYSRFTEIAGELWYENLDTGIPPMQTVAVSEDQFIFLDSKGYQYRFIERSTGEYDMEMTDGQIVYYHQRADSSDPVA